jgi:hypothetical protein
VRTWLTVPAALLLAVTAACGTNEGPPTEEMNPTPKPSQTMTSPQVPPTPGGNFAEVTGTVVAGAEEGCLILDTGDTRYVLLGGDRGRLTPDSRLTVTGVADARTQTTCSDGIPLEITEIEEAG